MRNFYHTTAWRKARKLQLQREPTCRHCRQVGRITPATDVDHIQRIKDGGSALDPLNFQSLCHDCHARKSAHEGRGTSKPLKGWDANGLPLDPSHPWNKL